MNDETQQFLMTLRKVLVNKRIQDLPDLSPYSIRKIAVDGWALPITRDFKPNRINVKVDSYNFITSVESLG